MLRALLPALALVALLLMTGACSRDDDQTCGLQEQIGPNNDNEPGSYGNASKGQTPISSYEGYWQLDGQTLGSGTVLIYRIGYLYFIKAEQMPWQALIDALAKAAWGEGRTFRVGEERELSLQWEPLGTTSNSAYQQITGARFYFSAYAAYDDEHETGYWAKLEVSSKSVGIEDTAHQLYTLMLKISELQAADQTMTFDPELSLTFYATSRI